MRHGRITLPALFLGGAMAVFGADIGTTVDTMVFDPGLNGITGFNGDDIPLSVRANIHAGFAISDNLNLTFTVENDPILLTRVLPLLNFSYNLIELRIGPFIGLSDIQAVNANPGISMALDINAAGIVFGSLRYDSSIDGGSLIPRNYAQEMWEIKAGLWTPFSVFSIGAQNRSFLEEQGPEIHSNKWTRYTFSMDIYRKNSPRTFRIDMGMQELRWMPYNGMEDSFAYNMFFMGMEFQWQVSYLFKITIGAESSVYCWDARKSLEAQNPDMLLLKFHMGMLWTLGQ
jgi:hypothetical protein